MANVAIGSNTLEQLTTLSQLTLVRQIVFMLLIAAAVAMGTSVVLWSQESNYTVLYTDLSGADVSEIATALDQAQLKYRIEPGTGYLAVPQEDIQQIRLHLASLGLPRATTTGYDVLSEEFSLGTSNFIEQARYNRALEQELVKTIKLLRGVRDVRVHISIPKQSSFLRSSSKASASVMLDVVGLQAVSETQIAGVAHLVASSVAGLNSEDVSIVDQKGNLLSKSGNDPLGNSSDQLKYTRNLEQEYTQRIIDILAPVVGSESIRAQVTADLDFTVIETTEENFNPANKVIRSEQTLEENRNGGGTNQPSLSATPPETTGPAATTVATQNNGQTRVNATRNYEIDKSVSYIRTVPGGIRRLTVAVLVDLDPQTIAEDGTVSAATLSPEQQDEKISRLTQLVKDSIGFNENRGDSINIISERFSPIAPELEVEAAPIWESPWVPSALKQLGASIVVLMLIFMVLKPALKDVLKPLKPAPAPRNDNNEEVEVLEDGTTVISKKAPQRSHFDENLALAQNVVANEPARAARMLKDWVASD